MARKPKDAEKHQPDFDPQYVLGLAFGRWMNECLGNIRNGFDEHVTNSCQSPIEVRMLAELVFMRAPWGLRSGEMQLPILVSIDDEFAIPARQKSYVINGWDFDFEPGLLYVMPQAQIGKYRVDFAIEARVIEWGLHVRIAVECDGHDFHERTKEQAQRDKQRDRELTTAGYRVFRFTGSEIFRDARKCVCEIEEFLDAEYLRVLRAHPHV